MYSVSFREAAGREDVDNQRCIQEQRLSPRPAEKGLVLNHPRHADAVGLAIRVGLVQQ